MITGKVRYKNINDTLRHLKIQVIDSLPYAKENVPKFNYPYQLFEWLKSNITYRNDPRDTELLQTMQTLFEGNYPGYAPGEGDCDCFVISCLASCYVQGPKWRDLIVTIAGRDKFSPVHIWSGINFDGQYYAMDLTQPEFDSTRHYKYTQDLIFKI